MDALMLDGNAVAGLLQELFAREMTTVIAICGTCGGSEPLGSVHVYRGAGTVLRCPRCDSVLAKIVTRQPQLCIDLSGCRAFAF